MLHDIINANDATESFNAHANTVHDLCIPLRVCSRRRRHNFWFSAKSSMLSVQSSFCCLTFQARVQFYHLFPCLIMFISSAKQTNWLDLLKIVPRLLHSTLRMTPSSAILNNRHESPSPCRSPRQDSKELECSPEIFTQFFTPCIVAVISLVSCPRKLFSSMDEKFVKMVNVNLVQSGHGEIIFMLIQLKGSRHRTAGGFTPPVPGIVMDTIWHYRALVGQKDQITSD